MVFPYKNAGSEQRGLGGLLTRSSVADEQVSVPPVRGVGTVV